MDRSRNHSRGVLGVWPFNLALLHSLTHWKVGKAVFIWITHEQVKRENRPSGPDRRHRPPDCQLVCKLYGLTEEEVEIVEQAATK